MKSLATALVGCGVVLGTVLWGYEQRRDQRARSEEATESADDVPVLSGAAGDFLTRDALARVRLSRDPMRTAMQEQVALRRRPAVAVAEVMDAWSRGQWWLAVAILSAVGDAATSATSDLVSATLSDDPREAEAAAVGLWCVNGDLRRAVSTLLSIEDRIGGRGEEFSRAFETIRALGGDPTPPLIAELQAEHSLEAILGIAALGPAAAEAVPDLEKLALEVSLGTSDRPHFGSDGSLLREAIEALASLGGDGREAVKRLLFSESDDASRGAAEVVGDLRRGFMVAPILGEARRRASDGVPPQVYALLATMPSKVTEWIEILQLVVGADGFNKRVFLEHLPDQLGPSRTTALVEVVAPWTARDSEFRESALSTLMRVAPDDPIVSRLVVEALTGGLESDRHIVAPRLSVNFERFSGDVRKVAVATAKDAPEILEALIRVVENGTSNDLDDATASRLLALGLGSGDIPGVHAALRAMRVRPDLARPLVPAAIRAARTASAEVKVELVRTLGLLGGQEPEFRQAVFDAWAATRLSREAHLRERVLDSLGAYRKGGGGISVIVESLLRDATTGIASRSQLLNMLD